MNPTRTVLGGGVMLALLIGPPVVLTRHGWPVGEEVTWGYLKLSLLSATLPPSVLHALVLAALWALWVVFALLVTADLVALVRGQVPRIGLLRLAMTGLAGSSVVVTAPAVAAVAPADNTPTDSAPEVDSHEPAHVLERTRTLPGFGFDSAELTPTMQDELLPTVELLQLFGDPDREIVVTGHTDAYGPDEHNRDLSQRRADSVAAYLTEQLGESWTVTTEGLGSDQPRDHADLGPAADRRAEITYTLTTQQQTPADAEQEPDEAGTDTEADDALTDGAQDTNGFPGGAVLAGAVAGGAVGAVAGRLTAPGRRRKHRAGKDTECGISDEVSEYVDTDQPMGNPVSVTRATDAPLISDEGHIRIADNLSVSARDGLGIVGTHAVAVCASLIGRALADPMTRVITTRDMMTRAGAPDRVRAAGLVVSADTASAITEAELAYISAGGPKTESHRTLLLVEAPEHALVDDRLRTLAQGTEDNDLVVVVLGEEGHTPAIRCNVAERVHVMSTDGSTATYEDLRLLHIDRATFAAHFNTSTDTPDCPAPDESEAEEEGDVPADAEQAETSRLPPAGDGTQRIQLRLFAPQPRITHAGVDISTKMRAASRRLLAYLALHPEGVGTEALTDALFPDTTESKARTLRNTACTSARGAIREALDDPAAEIIDVASGRYQIRREAIDVDVWRFDAELKAAGMVKESGERLARLRSASAEYTQELLTEADLPWIEAKRQAYRRAAAECFVSLAKAADSLDQAIRWLEKAVASDDLNEAVYQGIMRTQAALGRPDAVQRTYQDLSERLKSMRARPSAATNKLFHELTEASAVSTGSAPCR
ncbi:outer membrane protein OmpA-like peptidoglycan-associated protein [Nocardiopsis sp. Huas11]|uniref:OmpA family protein n=1 Tax=Nocardiopsis sp. Huas11 TaxID=2183912 RepID=UPI000EB346D6|nr:OmpA family protein [Nocardiopsis sp. Huas11]RKS05989.1 outer membrane protein OmpA-like peptidoglycan-associated protein [Nocardiopsis sp. Huas11]